MRNRIYTLLLFVSIVLFSFSSCKKAKKEEVKITKYEVKETYVLPQAYTLSGIHLNDTINRIFGALLMPISSVKEYSDKTEPIINDIGIQMQAFVDEVGRRGKKNGDNYIEIRPIYFVFHGKEVYSCLIKKTICLTQEDTIRSYNTINFNHKRGKILGFDDVFSVSKENLNSFLSMFSKDIASLSLEELKKIDFNIETDSISLNVKGNKITNHTLFKRYKQSVESLTPYLKTKEMFQKQPKER